MLGSFRKIFKIVRGYRLCLVLVLVLIVFTSIIDLIYPYLTALLIDEVFYKRKFSYVVRLTGVFAILFIINQTLFFFNHTLQNYLSRKMLYDIRRKAIERVLNADVNYLIKNQVGEIMKVIDEDVNKVLSIIVGNFWIGITEIIRFIFIITILVKINTMIAIAIIVAVPLNSIIIKKCGKYIKDKQDEIRANEGKLQSWSYDFLSGIKVCRRLPCKSFLLQKFDSINNEVIRSYKRLSIKELGIERVNKGIAVCMQIMVYTISAYLFISNALTIGMMTAVIDYYYKGIRFWGNFLGRYVNIKKELISVNKVLDILEIPEEESGHKYVNENDIQINNLYFSFEGNNIFSEFSLNIKKGESIAIIGKNGCGKSTLIYLLLNIYHNFQGQINYGIINIRDLNVNQLRRDVYLLESEIFLIDGTIRDFFRWGNKNYKDEEIYQVCSDLEMNFIYKFPNGLDTSIGEKNCGMSGGEKQLLAIARMFLATPSILIMDEATSALDVYHQDVVSKMLRKKLRNSTKIIISHIYQAFELVDRVIVMEAGRIIDEGTNEELLKRCPFYMTLFNVT